MFYECSSLEEINFNNFDTSKVNSMEAMFRGLSNLKSIDLSNFITSQVKNMYAMFYGCTSLEYLDISNFNTSQVTSSGIIFGNVKYLKYINLYYAQINNDIKSQIEDIMYGLTIVCQDKQILSGGKKDCSVFTQTANYIIVQYGTKTTYGANTFTNVASRQQIQYIKYKDEKFAPSREFTIEANEIIQIYLPKDIISFTEFFWFFNSYFLFTFI